MRGPSVRRRRLPHRKRSRQQAQGQLPRQRQRLSPSPRPASLLPRAALPRRAPPKNKMTRTRRPRQPQRLQSMRSARQLLLRRSFRIRRPPRCKLFCAAELRCKSAAKRTRRSSGYRRVLEVSWYADQSRRGRLPCMSARRRRRRSAARHQPHQYRWTWGRRPKLRVRLNHQPGARHAAMRRRRPLHLSQGPWLSPHGQRQLPSSSRAPPVASARRLQRAAGRAASHQDGPALSWHDSEHRIGYYVGTGLSQDQESHTLIRSRIGECKILLHPDLALTRGNHEPKPAGCGSWRTM
mmetsp:Transcript_11360/g.22940  ORF Transcript_11360/g.22940 Transcript_11360/m.22940 type:complete len:295 (-) Transcript_11360:85-969(-)